MPCYYPNIGYYSADVGRSGKRLITFNRQAAVSQTPLRLPCGRCVGCRLEKSRQWAMRCLHEKRMHEHSQFVTLTYDDKHLPPGGTLVPDHFSLHFMKRLRDAYGSGIRFYACGEYGEENGRPHYHAILFNHRFEDTVRISENRRGDPYYGSARLTEIWEKGRTLIGDVTFDSAAYVARYVLKKITGDKAAEHYAVVDGDGQVFDRHPEFTRMSRRPGIGAGYYERFGHEIRGLDSVVVNGKEVRPPRFYDKRFEELDPVGYDDIRKRRHRAALLVPLSERRSVDRRRVKEVLALKLLHQKKRTL